MEMEAETKVNITKYGISYHVKAKYADKYQILLK